MKPAVRPVGLPRVEDFTPHPAAQHAPERARAAHRCSTCGTLMNHTAMLVHNVEVCEDGMVGTLVHMYVNATTGNGGPCLQARLYAWLFERAFPNHPLTPNSRRT